MLEVNKLTKTYGGLIAANEVTFSLQPGDVLGFIGSNGAGKTTTIRMISTLLDPTSGTATLNGVDVVKDPMQIRRMIGYMPDFFGLYDDVKVWEYLDYFATIYEVPVRDRPKVIDGVLELTDLTIKKDAFVQTLSRGMQQRLALARCLVHDPTLLLLDEPASGLDPRARSELKELIIELGRMGKIIIVSSHILPELAGFCNTVGIIERGNLLQFGPIDAITRGSSVTRNFALTVLADRDKVCGWLIQQPMVEKASILANGEIGIVYAGTVEQQADLLERITEAKLRLTTFKENEANLEDVFLKLTTGAVN